MDRQTGKPAAKQTRKQTDRQTETQTDRQTEKQADRSTARAWMRSEAAAPARGPKYSACVARIICLGLAYEDRFLHIFYEIFSQSST